VEPSICRRARRARLRARWRLRSRFRELRSAAALASDAGATAGEHAVTVLKRGTLDVALSIPPSPVQQTPHSQDEVYVVIRGRAVLLHEGERESVEAGDLLFVAAGAEHQLVDLTKDFAVWRFFYGVNGGEVPATAGA
jgi:mannose-6-phosphate isomerase-like protein (cupin superfamily)